MRAALIIGTPGRFRNIPTLLRRRRNHNPRGKASLGSKRSVSIHQRLLLSVHAQNKSATQSPSLRSKPRGLSAQSCPAGRARSRTIMFVAGPLFECSYKLKFVSCYSSSRFAICCVVLFSSFSSFDIFKMLSPRCRFSRQKALAASTFPMFRLFHSRFRFVLVACTDSN